MVSEMYERCPRAVGAPAGRPARGEGGVRAGLTLAQAEGLLDWLEAHGHTGLGACLLEDGGVTVHWDGPIGFGR